MNEKKKKGKKQRNKERKKQRKKVERNKAFSYSNYTEIKFKSQFFCLFLFSFFNSIFRSLVSDGALVRKKKMTFQKIKVFKGRFLFSKKHEVFKQNMI